MRKFCQNAVLLVQWLRRTWCIFNYAAWALLFSIKDIILSTVFQSPSKLCCYSVRTVAWLIFSTKILSCSQLSVTSTAGTQMFHVFSLAQRENVAHAILFSNCGILVTSTSKPPIEVSVHEKCNHLFGNRTRFLLHSKPQECCVCWKNMQNSSLKSSLKC